MIAKGVEPRRHLDREVAAMIALRAQQPLEREVGGPRAQPGAARVEQQDAVEVLRCGAILLLLADPHRLDVGPRALALAPAAGVEQVERPLPVNVALPRGRPRARLRAMRRRDLGLHDRLELLPGARTDLRADDDRADQ